jgi:hypothetical protein
MRQLKDIRLGALDKSNKGGTDTAHVIKVKNTTEKITVSGQELALLELGQVSDKRRKELADINDEIEIEKVKHEGTGEGVVNEANTRAKEIIARAELIRNNASDVSRQLSEELEEARIMKKQAEATQIELDEQTEDIKRRTGKLDSIESRAISLKENNHQVLKQSQSLAQELAAIVLIAIQRLDGMDNVFAENTQSLAEIVDSLRKTIAVINKQQSESGAKAEHLGRKEKQLDGKEAIIKEQRLQLKMASKEVKNV